MTSRTLGTAVVVALFCASGASAGATTKPHTTQQVAQDIAKALPIDVVVVYTAASDPNHLLGRPGNYTSKVAFTDPRVSGAALEPPTSGAVDDGGSVEVFPDHSVAVVRMKYLSAIEKAAPALVSEYDYLSGGALPRVSGIFTPSQAAQFKAVLANVMKGKVAKHVANLGPTATTTTF